MAIPVSDSQHRFSDFVSRIPRTDLQDEFGSIKNQGGLDFKKQIPFFNMLNILTWFKRDQLGEIRVPLQGSIAGRVFTFGEPVVVQDGLSDERIYRNVDINTNFETHISKKPEMGRNAGHLFL